MNFSYFDRNDHFLVTLQERFEDIDASEGFEDFDFPEAVLRFVVAENVDPETQQMAYEGWRRAMGPKALELSVLKLLDDRAPGMFKEMCKENLMADGEPFAWEDAQSMYVSAMMSGAQVGIKAFLNADISMKDPRTQAIVECARALINVLPPEAASFVEALTLDRLLQEDGEGGDDSSIIITSL